MGQLVVTRGGSTAVTTHRSVRRHELNSEWFNLGRSVPDSHASLSMAVEAWLVRQADSHTAWPLGAPNTLDRQFGGHSPQAWADPASVTLGEKRQVNGRTTVAPMDVVNHRVVVGR